VEQAFKNFDRDGDGVLTVQELTMALQRLGERVSQEEVAQMVAQASSHPQKDRLGIADFKAMMMMHDEKKDMIHQVTFTPSR
jgi:Ca2+-binding EF-hand superfamily protein